MMLGKLPPRTGALAEVKVQNPKVHELIRKYLEAKSELDKDTDYSRIIIDKLDYALIARPDLYNRIVSKEIMSIEELQIAFKDSWAILEKHWKKAMAICPRLFLGHIERSWRGRSLTVF